jgi:hypothetical protein
MAVSAKRVPDDGAPPRHEPVKSPARRGAHSSRKRAHAARAACAGPGIFPAARMPGPSRAGGNAMSPLRSIAKQTTLKVG